MTRDLGDDLVGFINLDDVAYTTRFSRLLVRTGPDGLEVVRAAYERRLADSRVLGGLALVSPDGRRAEVARVSPWRIEFDNGATLVVTPEDEVHIEHVPTGWSVRADLGLPAEESRHVPASRVATLGGGAHVAFACAGPFADLPGSAAERVAHDLAEWMGDCPTVTDRWQTMTRRCWWVLGVNTLHLATPTGPRDAVVPSKAGYVGLWQWDAYFMSIGLRHGDPALALEQLRVAAEHVTVDGLLPDVVHEQGILASSDDLPPGDLETLRAMASPSLAHARVPLTKPPLLALAVAKLAEVLGPGVVDEFLPVMLANQSWWYERSTLSGRPVYLHPYSSGLDDSPIFDHDAIISSPDLDAYLVLSDGLLAQWLAERGRDDEAALCRGRAAHTASDLAAGFDARLGYHPSHGETGEPIATQTVVSLMPVLAQGLPGDQVAAVVAAIDDPAKFGAPHRLPTVSQDDPAFAPTRMWRGPVWVNTTWLVAQGLRSQGHGKLAERLEVGLLELVDAQGPREYFRPDIDEDAHTAVPCFGWTSALAIDIAVGLR
ncbi:MGH1-like glycoside hydrolase domain-containing protein [Propionibacteriaceae bacterium G57]|uniref:MGH1-like glycoside hydrolase domain-containing protein n=1 Tax=Aestuariimicrobium sp. G57 TaxID=3418485 RepID=UPI003DA797D9